ncbi:hypothetical protein SAMN05444358_10969 [Ruegeria halocynthiae]|uniref:Uncharacterized protein n=1 Tax=Ruegeria halocynthiae TaxID=985054 RepID=A0A1H3DSZ1_9RHOB|nr:hypothetical protein [Ruegeria halocynthiae]SDX69430.1 hypothetical protein SAMN05444358_10969 [Ruegeria halocynthiae]
MTYDRMTDLSKVAEAVFQRDHQKLRPLLQREAQLLNQLARLDSQLAAVKATSAQADGYHVTGTDLLWHSWESATRRDLNTELARLRSQKLAAMENLRGAFGRKQAVTNLAHRVQDHKRRAAQSRSQEA